MRSHHAVLSRLVPGAFVVLLTACGGSEAPVEQRDVVRPVKTLEVGAAENNQRSFPGTVAAANQVDLSFRVDGPLIELPVIDGQAVRRGHVIARIDPRDYRNRLASAQARFDRADADFTRIGALYEKDAVSKAQLDQARAERDIAEASLEDAQADLDDTTLRAPFSSLIGEVIVENFQDVRAKEPIASLVDVTSLEIWVDAPEALVARVRDDQNAHIQVTARFETAPGREFELELKEAAAQADPRTQTYRITFSMPQPDGINILPGMTATVTGSTDRGWDDEVGPIVVPAVAVASDDSGAAHVWVVDEAMTVSQRAIRTGDLVGADRIQVLDGLSAGETIAISAVSRLREGMQIRKLGE